MAQNHRKTLHNIFARSIRLSSAALALPLILASLELTVRFAHAIPQKPFLVVVDPGHGGSDLGALEKHNGNVVYEKNITLSIGRLLVQELARRKIQSVLTRNSDQEVDLPERTAAANKLKADIFISLHMNSAGGRNRANGVETYILNRTDDQSSKRLADLENKVLKGSVAKSYFESDVSLIVKDLILDRNLAPSKRLACAVQSNLIHGQDAKIRNRGVRQGLFYVLLGADMPSVLVETGFMDDRLDLNRALSPEGQQRIAASIANAIDTYKSAQGQMKLKKSLTSCQVL